jgi:phage tail sheath gpL-like
MPLDSLRDGFVRVCLDPSANVYQGKCRILVEGQALPVTPVIEYDRLYKVPSARDVESRFGVGSVLSEALKRTLACCANQAVDIYALPREDAVAGVAAEYTLTITGTATADGRVDLYMGEGAYNTSTLVHEGDTPTVIAAAIVDDILPSFPFDAVAALGVITFTAKNAGTVGNCLFVQPNWHERMDYAPAGVTLDFVSTVPGTGNPAPLNYLDILGECCYCCITMAYDDPEWQDGMIAYIADAWSCDKPQCFGHGYTYNSGTLGQILATDTNSAEVSRLAQCCNDPVLGYLKAAAYSATSCCSTVDNPELSIQGPTYGTLDCLLQPEACTQCFTFDEQEQLRDSGFVVTVPLAGGTGAMTNPMVTNDITNNRYDAEGRENATFQDVNSRRLAAETADEMAKELQKYNGLGLFTKNTNIRAGVLGTNPRLMLGGIRAWAKENVGVLFSEFDNIDKDITVQTDFQVAPKCQGRPDKLHVTMVYRPPVRVGQIDVNLVPKLLDNCDAVTF